MNQPLESACPDCGEMVRVNSVRCWNCGAFMNRDLEAKFLELQAKPDRVIFSEIPEGDLHTVSSDGAGSAAEEDEGGFELTSPKSVVSTAPQVSSAKSVPVASPASSSATADAPPATPAVAEKPAAAGPPDDEADALLNIAKQDEAEIQRRRRSRNVAGTRTVGGGFVIFCPYGCKIEVKEDHRGKSGRCPKCRAPFIVPVDPPMFKKESAVSGAAEGVVAQAGAFANWSTDLHMHVVSLEKLKLKADSLLKEFVETDIAFGPDQLIVMELAKKAGGLFGGGGDKKKLETRQTAQTHLREGKPVEELTVAQKFVFTKDHVSEIKVVQPAASRTDSIFHGIPVFGEGRIAIQLPYTEASKDPLFVSMGLTQFWAFSKALSETYGLAALGTEAGIPQDHVYADQKCHYTSETFKTLENVPLYQADPTVQLDVVGYRCGSCGLTVSEAGRDREKLGGKTPKGIAKAKCPKCQQKMGENLLYKLKEAPPEAAATPAPAKA